MRDAQPQPLAAVTTANPVDAFTQHGRLLALPLLASTHFCMDVLLRGSVLDLGSVTEVLAFDPCALLRLYVLVAREFPNADERPQRLDECIIALGKAGLAQTLYPAPCTWQQQARLSAFAEHGVTVARCAQIAATTLGLCDQTAYVVGLLHDIGTLPAILGWTSAALSPEDIVHLTDTIAHTYQLPPALHRALLQIAAGDESSVWSALIEAAHQLADVPNPDHLAPAKP